MELIKPQANPNRKQIGVTITKGMMLDEMLKKNSGGPISVPVIPPNHPFRTPATDPSNITINRIVERSIINSPFSPVLLAACRSQSRMFNPRKLKV